jgi:small subunit ribosomal protein S1
VKVGDSLEVKVLELDGTNRRLALSHKHLEENPWDTFESIFAVGSVHKGTIVNKNDKGMVVELQYGIEGFCSTKNLTKEDGGKTEIGETLDFKVLEFSKEDRRITLSHRALWSTEEEKPAAPAAKAPAAKKAEPKGKTIANINQQSEKSTLGDLEALSALKEKMSAGKADDSAKSE